MCWALVFFLCSYTGSEEVFCLRAKNFCFEEIEKNCRKKIEKCQAKSVDVSKV